MERKVKKLNYFIILGFSISQSIFMVIMIVICIINKHYPIFFFFIFWSYLLSVTYLFSISVCDTCLLWFSSKKLEKYYYFIKNNFSDIAFPYTFMVFFSSWGVYFIGLIFGVETFLRPGQKIELKHIIINANVHLAITVMLVVELFLNERKEVKLNWYSPIANISIYIAYVILVSISKFGFGYNPYPFMEELNAGGMVLVGFVILLLLVECFFGYLFLTNKIRKYCFKETESGEDNNDLLGNKNHEENNVLTPD